ncbi:hypothetical protein VUR80DRAFT_8088 [Thermomyces stellatus]
MVDEKHRTSTSGLRTYSSWLRSMSSSRLSMRWWPRRSSWSRKEPPWSASSTTALITEFPRGRTPPSTPGAAHHFENSFPGREAARIKTPPPMEEPGSDGRPSTIVAPAGDVHSDECRAESARARLARYRPTPTKTLFRSVNRSWPKIPRVLRPPADTRVMSEPPCRRNALAESLMKPKKEGGTVENGWHSWSLGLP